MFRGNWLAKIDDKGRLKLPAAFRSIIEPKFGREFFVTSLTGDSIRVYPLESWIAVEERIKRAASMDPAVMKFRRAVSYYGQTASMDSQGRIVLHGIVRDKAKADGEVAVLGQQDFLEVWNREAFEAGLEDDPLTLGDFARLAELGI